MKRQENRTLVGESHGTDATVVHAIGAVEAVPGGADVLLTDPQVRRFHRLIVEKRANLARQAGAMSGVHIASAANNVVAEAAGRPAPSTDRPRRRIPEAEQEQTVELLRGVPDLDEADARDLARIGTTAEFRQALEAMDGQRPRTLGGWLRDAVMKGWRAKEK